MVMLVSRKEEKEEVEDLLRCEHKWRRRKGEQKGWQQQEKWGGRERTRTEMFP